MSANVYLPGVIAIPSSLIIVGMTQSFPLVVTVQVPPVTAADTYLVGQLVRLTVPRPYGMYQANQLTAQILSRDATSFTLNIDSTRFDTFTLPPNFVEQPASLAPAGSRNLQFDNTTGLLPFQSLNNTGN